MTAPAHYAIGAASALLIQNYLPAESSHETRIACALVAAIASHVVADAIPHAEHFLKGWHLALELIIETMVMFVVLVGASRSPIVAAIILAGMVGAAIPDGLHMLRECVGWPILSWVDDKLHFYHGKIFFLLYVNLRVQLAITILCSIFVRIKSA